MESDGTRYEIVSRCLDAASGAVPPDDPDSLYLVHAQGDKLVERCMNGSQTREQDEIATDIKNQSPAAYLYGDTEEVFRTRHPVTVH